MDVLLKIRTLSSISRSRHRQHQHNQYSGVYYWQRASREDTVQVKLETSDDEETTEIVTVGNVRAFVCTCMHRV